MFTFDQWLPWRQPPSGLQGKGYIAGVLKVNDIPSARRVLLFDRATSRVIGTVFSNSDGTYRFDGLNPEIEFDLRGQDWARVRRDDIASAVEPKPYPP